MFVVEQELSLLLQDARDLYQAAVDKLQAVIEADPASAQALRSVGLALMDMAALPDSPSQALLQVLGPLPSPPPFFHRMLPGCKPLRLKALTPPGPCPASHCLIGCRTELA